MKKTILLVWITACILTACKDKTITLTGKFATSEHDGKVAYLQQLDSLFRVGGIVDSTIIENSKFVFKGVDSGSPSVLFVVINDPIMTMPFIAEKGKIELDVDSDSNVTLKGTALNDQFQQYTTEKLNVVRKIASVQDKMINAKDSGDLTSDQFHDFDNQRKQLNEELGNTVYKFIKPIMKTRAGQCFLVYNFDCLNDMQLKELISLSTSDFKQIDGIQQIEKQIETRAATAIGKQFTDVKGLDPDGKEVSLSDYAGKGKIVLVDFWASWCGPCLRAMPDLINMYQKYKSQGFEIVGISLDDNNKDWKSAIETLQIPWPQLSNLKAWKEDAAIAYGVNFIPQTVLIDPSGKIIDNRLDGNELKFKLEDLFEAK